MRVTYNGDFNPCRWQYANADGTNIRDTRIIEFYNGEQMRELRRELLEGKQPERCADCYYQDQHGKLSGRIKQLNKSGILQDHFDLSTRSSPHYEHFKYSQEHNGVSTYYPVDLQIDLGNICNSACIMCSPIASTRLQQDFKKLNRTNPIMFAGSADFTPWTRDRELLDRVINELIAIPNLRYIHFLGGETLYDSAFYEICEQLVAAGRSKDIIVGITTNGTIYDSRVEELIRNFKEFHLGISIESVTELNDYIRYPSAIEDVKSNIDKFLKLRNSTGLYVSLRITPNVFSISEIDKLLDYMLINNVSGESCNILSRPEHLRIELLPQEIRQETIEKLRAFIETNNIEKSNEVNLRRPDLIASAIGDLAAEYLTFLETYTAPDNVETLRYQLVEFLNAFEGLRGNRIIDYVPRYAEFLRHYGY